MHDLKYTLPDVSQVSLAGAVALTEVKEMLKRWTSTTQGRM